jgi:hypothetical protein
VDTEQLFPWPEAIREGKTPTPRPGPAVVPRGDYELIAFLRSAPGFHLVRSTNNYGSSITWCGQTGRVVRLGDETVPQCIECETARAEDEMTAKQQMASRRAAGSA